MHHIRRVTFARACALATLTVHGDVRHACCKCEMVAATRGFRSACMHTLQSPSIYGVLQHLEGMTKLLFLEPNEAI